MVNNLKKSKVIYLMAATVVSFLCGVMSLLFIQQSEDWFRERVSDVFLQSVFQDRDSRLIQSGQPFTFTHNAKRSSDSVWIESAKTVRTFDRPTYVDSLTLSSKEDRMMQSALRMCDYPIQVSVLDGVFRENLYNEGYNCRTAVCYMDMILGKNDYSVMDTTLLRAANVMTKIQTGIHDEIVLEGYVFSSWWSVLGDTRKYIFLLWVVWLLMMVFLPIYYRVYRSDSASMECLPMEISEAIPSVAQEGNTVYLSSLLCWKVKERRLLRDGEEICLTPQFRTMFAAFINSPEYFVSHDQLYKALWGESDCCNKKDRLDQAMKRFRQTLAVVPDLEIENSRGKGYLLKVVSKDI